MRRTAPLLFVYLAWTCLAVPLKLSAAEDDTDLRTLRVEQWLKAVLHHTPGATDDAVVEISSWRDSQLETLEVDERVLVRLMRDPRLLAFASKAPTLQPGSLRSPQPIPYTPSQLHRLKVLACAAAGIVTQAPCLQLNPTLELDTELSRLAALASEAKERGDGNYVLRRGALLHTDAAMVGAESLAPLNTGGPAMAQRVRVTMSDGRQTGVGLGDIHWEIAGLLLDAVRPEHDAMVNLWYRATAAWMEGHGHHHTAHLNHAREMFPDDADILFLSACQRETYAGPEIQSVVRSAVLPTGQTLDIGSERAELREAETFFRRALKLNPSLVEGRLRLGHVLLARGSPQEAADELRAALASTGDPLLQYFGTMFLGAAEEALGHLGDARDSYARAAALYPRAQSPSLAMSALATRHGDRAGALAAIGHVFDLRGPAEEREDPWWTYHVAQARNADELLGQLWRPFLEAQP